MIFITVNDGSIARNILHSFVLEKLLDDPEVNVGLIVPEAKASFYEKEFGSPRVAIFPYARGPLTVFEKILTFLSRNGIATRTTFTDQHTQFLDDHRFFWFLFKRWFVRCFGSSLWYHHFVRWLASFRKPAPLIAKWLREDTPAILFSTDIQSELDLDAMAAARKRKMKIVGMVRSWDNLSSRSGLVQIVPDCILVWNPYLFGHAKEIQHLPPARVKVVGIPQYDWFLRKEILVPRAEFLARFGISPEKKVILFAGIGNFLAPHEAEVAELLSGAIAKGQILADVAVVFRPHPHFLTERAYIKKLPFVVFDDGVADYTGEERSSWEMDKDKFAHLINSLYHADLVITIASTITMDAAVFDKPVICVAFDGKTEEPYGKSVRRFYHDYTHYISLTATHGFKVAYNISDLVVQINLYLRSPHEDAEGRQKIIKEFIGKLDGHSADRIAGEILKLL